MEDHPLRYELANEMHARPFPALDVPCTAVFLALKRPGNAAGRDRAEDMAHLCALLDRHGAPHPKPDATHYFGPVGRHWIKWESHTEVVTYTAFSGRLSPRAFDPSDFEVFPADWLGAAPGQRITSALIRVEARGDRDAAGIAKCMADWFVPESLAASHVLDDAAVIAGDFRIDPAGHLRFAVFVSDGVGRRRVGRIVQRLCEIETYKTLSLLGFARARALSPELARTGARLTDLVDDMGEKARPAEETLGQLLEVSGTLEQIAAQTSFRFSATAAYERLVHERVEVMREARFAGRQTFAEFMLRRFDPAMRTVRATEARLQVMVARAARAANLLRTRVDVERSAQNQALLESMDRRSDLQLRLQRTVEGLSVVAISYYAVSLAAYALYPLAEAMGLPKGTIIAAITLPVVGLVWWLIRRVQRKLH
ncbi:MAG: putative membrane-anchored protein conserved in bacteria [Rhodobacteraceae bacterium HLUCCO07]|nr:MAG: putative membrane-anchored protein conserved in bacteria [Rhodobacteraceae bacterium HLUCCO07]